MFFLSQYGVQQCRAAFCHQQPSDLLVYPKPKCVPTLLTCVSRASKKGCRSATVLKPKIIIQTFTVSVLDIPENRTTITNTRTKQHKAHYRYQVKELQSTESFIEPQWSFLVEPTSVSTGTEDCMAVFPYFIIILV